MTATYKRMEKVLIQHLNDLERACTSSASTTKESKADTPKISEKENNINLTPESSFDDDELRLQSSPFGVKNLLMASGGARAQNSQKLHCV